MPKFRLVYAFSEKYVLILEAPTLEAAREQVESLWTDGDIRDRCPCIESTNGLEDGGTEQDTEADRQLLRQLLEIKRIEQLQDGIHNDAVRGALSNIGIESCIEPGDTVRQMVNRAMEVLVTADADCGHVEALLIDEINAAIRRRQA